MRICIQISLQKEDLPMEKQMIELVMNPVRQRIIQCIALRGIATTAQMLDDLADVPKASLYRHVKLLHEGELLEVAEETKVRGTIERAYRLRELPVDKGSNDQAAAAIYNALMTLMSSFRTYFGKGDRDPAADRLFLNTSPALLMTDEEFDRFSDGLNRLVQEAGCNQLAEGRKPRRITIVSSPCQDNQSSDN